MVISPPSYARAVQYPTSHLTSAASGLNHALCSTQIDASDMEAAVSDAVVVFITETCADIKRMNWPSNSINRKRLT